MSGQFRLEFLQSAAQVDQLPDSLIEVAMVGRSNVGKSSLINALAGRRDLARTSKTPGATRLINVYELDPTGSGRWLVDLPGYGFARASRAEQNRWASMIEGYLTERASLAAVMLLIDGEVGPTKLDLGTVDWLDHIGCPFRFVATKVDKVKSSKRQKRRRDLVEALGVERNQVAWVSAHKNTGIPELRATILGLLDA